MALVNMQCPNCGAALQSDGNGFSCPYCGSKVVHIVDSIDADVSTLSVKQFRQKLKQSGRTYLINFEPLQGYTDVDAKILQGKLDLAQSKLQEGKFWQVHEVLQGVDSKLFAAERLRFLAHAGATDEMQLSTYAGDITAIEGYKALERTFNASARQTYEEIARVCLTNERVVQEILKGKQLLNVNLVDEAQKYAENMLNKYCTYARAWELLIEVRCVKDAKYNPLNDLQYMLACPDCYMTVTHGETGFGGLPKNIAPIIAERCEAFQARADKRKKWLYHFVLYPLILAAGCAVTYGLWQLIQ